MSADQDKRKPTRSEDVELASGTWERFTRTVRRMTVTPSKPQRSGRDARSRS